MKLLPNLSDFHGVIAINSFPNKFTERYERRYPGVASRSHRKIGPIIQEALDQANWHLDQIDVVAVTNNQGLTAHS